MAIIRRFFKFLKPHSKEGLKIALTLLGMTLITVVTPYFYKEIIDHGILTGDIRHLMLMLVAIVLAKIVYEIFFLLQTSVTLTIRKNVFLKLRMDLYTHLLKLPQSFYAQNHKGGMLSRITSDVDAVQDLLLDRFISFMRDVLVGCFIFFIILSIQWEMIIATCIFLPLLYILYLLYKDQIFSLSKNLQEKQEKMVEKLQEDLRMVKTIQSYSAFDERTREAKICLQQTEDAKKKLSMRYALASSSTIIINLLGILIIWGIGGLAVIKGQMTIGTLIALSFYLNYIVRLFFSAYDTVVGFQKSLPAAQRIFEVMDLTPVSDDPEAVELNRLGGRIVFTNVSFAYANRKPVLQNVNFCLEQGDFVGIVGKSGEGKTTLANLMLRFYDPEQGEIEIQGINLKKIKLESLRRNSAIVPQVDYLFNASIKDNIRMGREGITEERLIEACEQAGIHTFVMRLEEQYDTLVGEDGIRLSVGQKKRISIARALLEDPYILILDEATTALDRESEIQILDSIRRLTAHRIVLMITHNMENIQPSDKLLQIQEGKVTVKQKGGQRRNSL